MEAQNSTVDRHISRRTLLSATGAALAIPVLDGILPMQTNASEEAIHAHSRPVAAGTKEHFACRLAEYICNVRFDGLTPAVVARAKEQLIYHVALAFTGALTMDGRQAMQIAGVLGGCSGQSTIIGQPRRVHPLEAAFVNSTFIRATGFDDVLFPSETHAGLLTFPTALAVAEQNHCSGEEFLVAIVTSYEVLGKMVTDQNEARAVRRPSMPFGPFAAVTAAARLMGLTTKQTANAIGYAADSAMGLKEGNEQQPTHVYGWISRNAITAAILAQAGGETAPTILEGKYGFYASLIGNAPNVDAIIERLGKDPEILRATQKRYPGTAMNIVPIQLILQLTQEHSLTAQNVAYVNIEIPSERSTFEDSYSTGPFPTHTQAASSLPFQTAIILLDGRINMSRYDELDNPQILAVINKVSVKLAPHANPRYARVRILTIDGKTLECEGDNYVFPPIDAIESLSRDGDKFLPRSSLERFAALAQDIETLSDVSPLMRCLIPSR
ncbi:MAG: MmgE/PrpD family protein [Steroidobacteraceae bacterium]